MAIKHDGKEFDVVARPGQYIWTEVKDALLTKLYKEGKKPGELAGMFKTSQMIIHRRLRVLDLPGDKLWTKKNDAFLRSSYREMSNEEMARKVGCNLIYVSDRLTYLGLDRRRRP